MRFIYPVHRVGDDPWYNIARIAQINRSIILRGDQPVPNYLNYLLCLDDGDPKERSLGIAHGAAFLRRQHIDAMEVHPSDHPKLSEAERYHFSRGMRAEVLLGLQLGIPVQLMDKRMEGELRELEQYLRWNDTF